MPKIKINKKKFSIYYILRKNKQLVSTKYKLLKNTDFITSIFTTKYILNYIVI